MNFEFSDELREHLKKTGKKAIAVELISTTTSDIDITELYPRIVNVRMAEQLKKRGYKVFETETTEVLLPKYVLEYSDTVFFSLKKTLFGYRLEMDGIKL